jgi:hypothetical protein
MWLVKEVGDDGTCFDFRGVNWSATDVRRAYLLEGKWVDKHGSVLYPEVREEIERHQRKSRLAKLYPGRYPPK